MEQYGIVIEVKEEVAAVHLQRHLICESCGRCGILSGSGKRDIVIEALNPIDAEIGQRVKLESDDNQVLFISFMLYLVPLVGLVAGILLWLRISSAFGWVNNQELFAALAGLMLMAVIFVVIRIWDRAVKDNPKYKPVITAIIDTIPECGEIENK